MKSHEMIYVFSKKGCNYNRIDEVVEGAKGYNHIGGGKGGSIYPVDKIQTGQEDGMRCALSVINIKHKQDKKHPTAKPNELYDWLIKRYSNEGDTILDPTAGSFNSGHSALGLKRNYIGMEMNDDFYDKNKIEIK
jgi:site-specific DNA-methyltransferase (adenine-specific)